MNNDITNYNEKQKINYFIALLLSMVIKSRTEKSLLGKIDILDEGFSIDIDLNGERISLNDFSSINKDIKSILKRNLDIEIKMLSLQEAKEIFSNNPYQLQRILEQGNRIKVIRIGDFYDVCNIDLNIDFINKIKENGLYYELLNSSSAYWQNNSNNKQLTRINGIGFRTKDELEQYKERIELAKQRDHRKLGKELDLFMFDDTAPGMPYWLPKGLILFNNLIDFWRDIHAKNNYYEFSAPQLNNSDLWKTSGHWDHYKDDMFVFQDADGKEQALKPMSCPNAIKIFKAKSRSYKDLPLRLNDVDVIHRNEASGTLHGLMRVRMFRQDDSHNFVTEDKIKDEFNNIFEIAKYMYKVFGLSFRPTLSTRPEDYMGDINLWNRAEQELKEVLDENFGQCGYDINEGDGAFYGPKVDLYMTDCLNRKWQMGTIQLDFQLPRRFNLSYVNEDGENKIPVIIHRTIYGSLERFIGILTEQYNGAFPMWMSPTQVNIIPVHDGSELMKYVRQMNEELEEFKVRSIIDESNEKLGYKIRRSQVEKTPITFIIGNKELEDSTISYRNYGSYGTQTDCYDKVLTKVRTLSKPPYYKK